MITSSRKAGFVLGLGLAIALGSGSARADEACRAAFTETVQPVLNVSCVACHQDAAPAGGLSLQRTSAYDALLGESVQSSLPMVTPGDPEQSYLFHKIVGTQADAGGSGDRMPIGGVLIDDDIALIEEWIAACNAP